MKKSAECYRRHRAPVGTFPPVSWASLAIPAPTRRAAAAVRSLAHALATDRSQMLGAWLRQALLQQLSLNLIAGRRAARSTAAHVWGRWHHLALDENPDEQPREPRNICRVDRRYECARRGAELGLVSTLREGKYSKAFVQCVKGVDDLHAVLVQRRVGLEVGSAPRVCLDAKGRSRSASGTRLASAAGRASKKPKLSSARAVSLLLSIETQSIPRHATTGPRRASVSMAKATQSAPQRNSVFVGLSPCFRLISRRGSMTNSLASSYSSMASRGANFCAMMNW